MYVEPADELCVHRLHNLAHVELNAIDLAWDTVARFSSLKLDQASCLNSQSCKAPSCMPENAASEAVVTVASVIITKGSHYTSTLHLPCLHD